MLDPDTLGRLSSFCALVCNLLSKVHTMLFWLLLIKEISVRSFHFSILSGIFRLNFSCNIKKVGWNAHILTVYHQRIIRKMLIYGNVAITNCCWWWVMRAEENVQMTLLVHLLHNYLIISYSKGCYAQKLKVFDIQPYPPINNTLNN